MALTVMRVGVWIGLLMLAACGDPVGSACDFVGSGFTASDNCRHFCLEHRAINCPDGAQINPHICSGKRQCDSGGCPDGQVCYHVDDPFNKESYCVPDDICGPQSPEVLAIWEKATLKRSDDTLREWEEKKERRRKWREENPDKITAPSELSGVAPAPRPSLVQPDADD